MAKNWSEKVKKLFPYALICIFLGIIFWYVFIPKYICQREYKSYVDKYSEEYNLDKNLVYSIIKTESNFNKDAVSIKKAMGLMQITEGTAKWGAEEIGIGEFNIDLLFDPETNIRIGCWYISRLLNQYKSLESALAAYNAGSGNVTKWLNDTAYSSDGITLKHIPFKETKNYLFKVKFFKKLYEIRYGYFGGSL